MTYELGSLVPLGVLTYDEDGALADPDAITLTITLPDATSVTPTPENPLVGTYEYAYPTVQTGRHVARWAGSGAVVATQVTEFWVVDTREAGSWLTTTDLAVDLGQTIPSAGEDSAQAAVDAAVAIVQSYCRARFTGDEPDFDAVKKVALRVATDFYVNPLQRDSYTGPESLTYSGSRMTAILTPQDRAVLDLYSWPGGFA